MSDITLSRDFVFLSEQLTISTQSAVILQFVLYVRETYFFTSRKGHRLRVFTNWTVSGSKTVDIMRFWMKLPSWNFMFFVCSSFEIRKKCSGMIQTKSEHTELCQNT